MNSQVMQAELRAKQRLGYSLFNIYDSELKIATAFKSQCNKEITRFWQKFSAKLPVPEQSIELTLSAWMREMDNGEYRVYMMQLESPVEIRDYGLSFNETGIELNFVN